MGLTAYVYDSMMFASILVDRWENPIYTSFIQQRTGSKNEEKICIGRGSVLLESQPDLRGSPTIFGLKVALL